MKQLSFLSLTTAPVQVLNSSGNALSRATGFFYKRDEKWSYFITSWHVVTGRDPMHRDWKSGAVPTTLRLTLHKNVGPRAISSAKKMQCDVGINDEAGESPDWLEHPVRKWKIDLVVVKISHDEDFQKQVTCHYLAEHTGFQENFVPSVTHDVFVIGYPWALTGGDPVLPLYKRGSIASEPIVDYEGLPRFQLIVELQRLCRVRGPCSHSGLWNPDGDFANSVIGTVREISRVLLGAADI